jgi:hypothetical protein
MEDDVMTEDQIKYMVGRFLAWRLPADFDPDCGISYTVPNHPLYADGTLGPTGTNLLCYTQAEAMVRDMLDGLPTPAQGA